MLNSIFLEIYDIIHVERGSAEDGTTIGREYLIKEMDDTIPYIINNSGRVICPFNTKFRKVSYTYIKEVVAEKFGIKRFNQLINDIQNGEYEAKLKYEIVDAYCFLNKIKN